MKNRLTLMLITSAMRACFGAPVAAQEHRGFLLAASMDARGYTVR